HDRTVAVHGEADHIDRADGAALDGLPLDEVLYRAQPVAVASRVLEALLGSRVEHLLLELALDRLHVAGEELDDAVDDRAVVLFRDVADAGREATVDVVVEARDARVPS